MKCMVWRVDDANVLRMYQFINWGIMNREPDANESTLKLFIYNSQS